MAQTNETSSNSPSPPAKLRVALVQTNTRIADLERNFAGIEAAIERAREAEADLVVFAETQLLGYPPRDVIEHDTLVDRQLAMLDRVTALTDDALGVVVGYVDHNRSDGAKPLRNAAAVCHRGEVIGRVFKTLLPTYDVFDADRYFEPATPAQNEAGQGVVRFKGVDLGISICEDAWNEKDFWEQRIYPHDPIAASVDAGAQLLINIAASPFYIDKGQFRREMMASHAATHDRWLVFVNQVGAHDELIFDGQSFVIGPDGDICCQLAEFAEDFCVCEIDLGERELAPARDTRHQPRLEPAAGSAAEQASRAIVLGIGDYFGKSGFKTAVLGLSGGIDSALTATLAARALGAENVTGVSMPTRYTSARSRTDAQRLADNLGIGYREIPIEPMFTAFLDQLDPVFGDRPADITEENIQARVRGMVLMALSNKFGSLVLAPGNKSELAVGYSTLYGDMCGALAVIGDCPKTLVYDMARWINADAGREIIPEAIITRPPTAELKPDQTDQDTLPPYEILDGIVDLYMEQGLSADAIVERGGYDRATVVRVLRLLHRAEYKRWQAPPILKVQPKSFGMGWRYPLAAEYTDVIGL